MCGILVPSIDERGVYVMEKAIDKYLNNLDFEIAYLKYVAEQLKLLNDELKESEVEQNVWANYNRRSKWLYKRG